MKVWAIFVFFLCFMLIACTSSHGSGGLVEFSSDAYPVVNMESLDAFENTVYAYGKTQGCVKCHGNTVSPAWASSNITAAYYLARPLMDVNSPTNSVFAAYAGNNHCGDPVCADAGQVPVMQDLLSQWAAVEINQGSSATGVLSGGSTLPDPAFVTATLAIPATLPPLTAKTPAVIRFDLSQLMPPIGSLSAAILEISIQSYNSGGTEYKVFNPRIIGNTAPVAVSGIHIYVRPDTGSGLGTEDIYQGDLWSGVKTTAAVYTRPTTLPSGPITGATPLVNTSLGIQVQSASDVITVGFASIQ